jgi:hypothetical protein
MDGVGTPALNAAFGPHGMTRLTPITALRVPLGGQTIELQQVDYDDGGMSRRAAPEANSGARSAEDGSMSLLRTRIREGQRFTVFDVDPVTALEWGRALVRWAETQQVG